MERAEIDGAWIVSPRVFPDDRGHFLEWFRGADVAEAIGYHPPTAQGNISLSRYGVVRGVHFSSVPPGQAKYVTCVSGSIFDVIVDIRPGSPTFGAWQGVRLDEVNRRAVYICEGLGHAFMAMSPHATVAYLCSTPYAPEHEHAVNPLDPAIGIDWPADAAPILSEKDAAAPTLAQARAAGFLPAYEDCTHFLHRGSDFECLLPGRITVMRRVRDDGYGRGFGTRAAGAFPVPGSWRRRRFSRWCWAVYSWAVRQCGRTRG